MTNLATALSKYRRKYREELQKTRSEKYEGLEDVLTERFMSLVSRYGGKAHPGDSFSIFFAEAQEVMGYDFSIFEPFLEDSGIRVDITYHGALRHLYDFTFPLDTGLTVIGGSDG